MYASSSALTTINGAFSDTGSLLVVILAAIVGGTIALMALGFAIRHVGKWITGKRF